MSGVVKGVLSKMGVNIGSSSDTPLLGNNYFVIIGTSILSFSKISGISFFNAATQGINEGGRNEPYIVEEPRSTLNDMVLEKGFGTVDILRLAAGAKSMILIMKDDCGNIQGAYYTGCMMIKEIKISDLNAQKSDVLIQSMTISYTNLKKAETIMKLASNGLGGFLGELLDYNSNEKEMQAVQAYSKKLTRQKAQTIEKNKEVAARAAEQAKEKAKDKAIQDALKKNKIIQEKAEQERIRLEEQKRREREKILAKLDK